MIIDYGFSIIGKSHVAKNGCCQDANKIKYLENGWVIAAVADGVGSARNSSKGSEIAVDTVTRFCEEYMPCDYSTISIKSMMRTAYNYAFKQISREAQKHSEPVESYDTTLTMVIYDGKKIIYGHSGDGAIIGLNTYGDYVEITTPQKGDDMISVLPLRAGYTQWVIDTYEEELAAVLLVTDGMLDTICPYLLKLGDQSIYTALAMFFADPNCFGGNEKGSVAEIEKFLTADPEYPAEDFYARIERALKKHIFSAEEQEQLLSEIRKLNYPVTLMQAQQDDKTVVGLINMELELESKPPEYYKEPDWSSLNEEWNRRAYPQIYVERDREESRETELAECPEEQPAELSETLTVPEDRLEEPSQIPAVPEEKKAELSAAENVTAEKQLEHITVGRVQEKKPAYNKEETDQHENKKRLTKKDGNKEKKGIRWCLLRKKDHT